MMAIGTAIHRDYISFLKYKTSIYKLKDGGEVKLEGSIKYGQTEADDD